MKREELINKAASHYAIERQKDPNYPVYNWEYEIENAYEAGVAWSDEHPDLYSVTRKAVETALKNLWLDAQGDDLPEIDREVIVLCINGEAYFGYRPDPKGFDCKNIDTGEIEHLEPMTYGKGGWNIPDVKWWLNVELPIEDTSAASRKSPR